MWPGFQANLRGPGRFDSSFDGAIPPGGTVHARTVPALAGTISRRIGGTISARPAIMSVIAGTISASLSLGPPTRLHRAPFPPRSPVLTEVPRVVKAVALRHVHVCRCNRCNRGKITSGPVWRIGGAEAPPPPRRGGAVSAGNGIVILQDLADIGYVIEDLCEFHVVSDGAATNPPSKRQNVPRCGEHSHVLRVYKPVDVMCWYCVWFSPVGVSSAVF